MTVWTYEPEMGECYIDDAETIAEDGIDPARMFTIWEEGFKKVMKGDAKLVTASSSASTSILTGLRNGASTRSNATSTRLRWRSSSSSSRGGGHRCGIPNRRVRGQRGHPRRRLHLRQGPVPGNDGHRQPPLNHVIRCRDGRWRAAPDSTGSNRRQGFVARPRAWPRCVRHQPRLAAVRPLRQSDGMSTPAWSAASSASGGRHLLQHLGPRLRLDGHRRREGVHAGVRRVKMGWWMNE